MHVPTGPLRRSITARARDERGMALVMAIGASLVLTVAGISLMGYGLSNERASQRFKKTHDAYQLAVSGVESAASQLAQASSVDPLSIDDPAFFTTLCGTPANCTQTFGTGESVSWTGQLCDDNPLAAACPYSGTPVDNYIPNLRWRITSVSTVPNPNGTGTIARTVTSDIRLTPTRQQVRDDQAWKYVYSWKTGDSDGCDMELPNNPNVTSSFYVAGNFCLDNNSSIVGPTSGNPPVDVVVRGNVELKKAGNDLGTSSRPLTSIYVEGTLGCKFRANPYNKPCTSVDHVRPDSLSGSSAIPVPTAQFDDWYYVASPGPSYPCDPALSSGAYPDFADDGVMNNRDKGALAFDELSSFTCKTTVGEFSWDASTNKLTVDGTVFWDGNLELDQGVNVTYAGIAALYVSGWFRMHQNKLCSVYTSGGDCDYAAWNTDQNILFIATNGTNNWSQCTDCGVLLEQGAQFQGALYADHNMGFQNNSFVQGPMVSKEELIQNSFTFAYIPPLVKVPFGTPSNTIVGWSITPPTNFSG